MINIECMVIGFVVVFGEGSSFCGDFVDDGMI